MVVQVFGITPVWQADHQPFLGDRSIRSIVFVSANEQRPLDAPSRHLFLNIASQ